MVDHFHTCLIDACLGIRNGKERSHPKLDAVVDTVNAITFTMGVGHVLTRAPRRLLRETQPVELSVLTPWWGFHSVLATDYSGGVVELVNYHPDHVVMALPTADVEMPAVGNTNRRAYALSLLG